MNPIKVLVVDDSAVVRLGIRKMLLTDSNIQVVGEAVNGAEAILQQEALSPDIITMDVNIARDGWSGSHSAYHVHAAGPHPDCHRFGYRRSGL